MIRQYLLLLAFAISISAADHLAARATVPVWGQCGGSGWTGATTCDAGNVCTYSNPYYSQCLPGTASTTAAPTSTTKSTSTSTSTSTPVSTGTGSLPTSFKWSSTASLIGPKNDGTNIAGIKDPSVIYYNGHYHVFASTAAEAGYSLVYMNFTDWSTAGNAPFYYLKNAPLGTGYRAAPEVFFFTPQNLWYLIYQNGNAAYSTNPDISNPAGWTAPKNFFTSEPSIIQQNIGSGSWVDMWVICDSSNCHLFSSDDNGHLYRSQTSLSSFPNGMGTPVIAMQDTANKYELFEASNVYHYGNNQYLLLVEAIGTDGHRYFRSWTMSNLAGPYTALADNESNPFARSTNIAFTGTPWTTDISHGEMVRNAGYDQTLTINPCKMQYLYQGDDPANTAADYNSIPWRLGLLTHTNPTC